MSAVLFPFPAATPNTDLQAPVVGTTDDWPFIYMRDRGVPLYPYGLVLLLVLVGGGGLEIGRAHV